MKKCIALLVCTCMALLSSASLTFDNHPTLPIGAQAPDFSLPGVDCKTYTLESFKDAKVLVIVFMCNHCPTSQAYEHRIIKLTSDYVSKSVSVVGINPNNPSSLRLDELGYSDVGDSFAEMKIRAKQIGFNFPYLYDGATEIASNKYGPVSRRMYSFSIKTASCVTRDVLTIWKIRQKYQPAMTPEMRSMLSLMERKYL